MRRRVIAAVVALALAAVGALTLVNYVAAADHRAMAGMETVNVLVVGKAVPKGTAAANLAGSVALTRLPQVAVPGAAVRSLDQLQGLVTTTDFQVGEQVTRSRFADPASQADAPPKVPAGLQEVSLSLEPQRVLGGTLTPGADVGVFFTVEKGTPEAQTHLTLQRVLVTMVLGAPTAAPADTAQNGATAAPSVPENPLMVTLAVTPAQAEQVVYAAENGSIWLSLQSSSSSTSGTSVVTERNLFR